MRKSGIFLIIILCCLYSFTNEKKTIIKIKPESKISGWYIKLGEIANIQAGDKEILQKLSLLSLGYAPKPMKEIVLDKSEMKSRLYKAGIDFKAMEVQIPEKVKIVSMGSIVEGKDLIEKAKKYMLEKLPWSEKEIEFKVKRLPDNVVFPDGDVEVKLDTSSKNFSIFGYHPLILKIFLNGKLKRRIDVSSYLEIYAPVYIANTRIEKGKIIVENDIKTEKMSIKEMPRDTIYKKEDVFGKETRLIISEGSPITTKMVQEPTSVKKGAVITVLVKKGNLEVTTQVEALENGKIGQTIKVRDINSRKILSVKITDSSAGEITVSE